MLWYISCWKLLAENRVISVLPIEKNSVDNGRPENVHNFATIYHVYSAFLTGYVTQQPHVFCMRLCCVFNTFQGGGVLLVCFFNWPNVHQKCGKQDF